MDGARGADRRDTGAQRGRPTRPGTNNFLSFFGEASDRGTSSGVELPGVTGSPDGGKGSTWGAYSFGSVGRD